MTNSTDLDLTGLDLTGLERQANSAARDLMGGVGWPTVILGITVAAIYVLTLIQLVVGHLGLFAAYALITLATYAIYTSFHDAVHGAIQGKNRNYAWVNNGIGYIAGQIMFIPFKIHQAEHMAHHRNTNSSDDPDLYVKNDSLQSLVYGTLVVVFIQYKFYFSKSWKNASSREKITVLCEIVIMIGWRVALLGTLSGFDALVALVLAPLSGIFLLVILFVWLVHRPHHETARYKNTNTIVFNEHIDTAITWAWLYQNYHSIHHLFPRVPFYNYKKLYQRIEHIMIANGAPISRIGQS